MAWAQSTPVQPKVCIATPIDSKREVSINWARALREFQWLPNTDHYLIAGLPWGAARNNCVQYMLSKDFTHLLFWDSDVIPPHDGMVKLLQQVGDVVSGLYYTRFAPVQPVAYYEAQDSTGKSVKLALRNFNPGDILQVDFVGMGFCLITRKVFESIPVPWFIFEMDVTNPTGASEDFHFCVLEDTFIYGNQIKQIKDVKIGDKVLTHQGTFQPVVDVFKRPYSGKLISIRAYHNITTKLTPNHPILIYRKQKGIIWTEASNIKVDDKLFLPSLASNDRRKTNIRLEEEIDLCNTKENNGKVYYHRTHLSASHIPKNITITPELMRLLGYYIAEGSANSHLLTFSFNKHEVDLINDTRELLDKCLHAKTGIYYQNNTAQVNCSSKILAQLFIKLCGKGAHNKHLPYFFLELREDEIKELVGAIYKGDGYSSHYKDSHYDSIISVSPQLAHEIRLIKLKLKELTGIRGGYISSQKAKHAAYEIRLNPKIHYNSSQSGFWMKIKTIDWEYFNGDVYNLEVANDQSYVANGITVHNCRKARAAGFKILLHTGIQCQHETRAVASIKGLETEIL